MQKILWTALFSLLCALPMACTKAEQTAPLPRAEAKVIFLVRHAEKAPGVDPELTAAGQERAALLADLVKDEGLTKIFSSPYKRTLQTALPVAEISGAMIVEYDPRDLGALSVRLMAECGVCLVVGHSNTTPQLAALLGAPDGGEIDEAGEYDRLYKIVIDPKGGDDGQNVTGEILRYGAVYEK